MSDNLQPWEPEVLGVIWKI